MAEAGTVCINGREVAAEAVFDLIAGGPDFDGLGDVERGIILDFDEALEGNDAFLPGILGRGRESKTEKK